MKIFIILLSIATVCKASSEDAGNPIGQYCNERIDGKYTHPLDCNKFIMCSNRITYEFKCPTGLRYNTDLKFCDWKANVPCIIEFCIGLKNGNYKHPKETTKFITCSNSHTFIMNCPSNLIFDVNTGRCEHSTLTITAAV